MDKIIKFILIAFVGIVCSLIILLISGVIHMYVAAGLMAGFVVGFLEYKYLAKSKNKKLISAVVFIIVAFLYGYLYSYLNVHSDGIITYIVFFMPYVLASWLFFAIRSMKDTQNANVENSEDCEVKVAESGESVSDANNQTSDNSKNSDNTM